MAQSENYPIPHEYPDDEIDLVDLILVVWKHRMVIMILSLSLAVLAGASAMMKSRTYTAKTSIINMVDNRFIRNAEGFDFQTMIQAPKNSILQAILASQSLNQDIVTKNNLMSDLYPDRWDPERKDWEEDAVIPSDVKAVERLKKMVRISANDRDSTLTISVTSRNPELSAKIANAFTRELDDYLKINTFSSVQKSKAFLEQQLEESRKTLEDLIRKKEAFQNENGIFDFENQVQASIKAYNDNALLLEKYKTEARITESISSSRNPKVLSLKQYIRTIENRMRELRTGIPSGVSIASDVSATDTEHAEASQYFIPLDRMTEFKVKMDKFSHDIKNQQKVHDLFVDAYEKITIQDAKEKIFVTVLDKAEPPLNANGRGTVKRALLGGFLGGFLGLMVCFGIEFYRNHLKERLAPQPRDQEKEAVPEPEPLRYYFNRDAGGHDVKAKMNEMR